MPPKTISPVKYSTIMKAKDKAYRYHMRLKMVKDAKKTGHKACGTAVAVQQKYGKKMAAKV